MEIMKTNEPTGANAATDKKNGAQALNPKGLKSDKKADGKAIQKKSGAKDDYDSDEVSPILGKKSSKLQKQDAEK